MRQFYAIRDISNGLFLDSDCFHVEGCVGIEKARVWNKKGWANKAMLERIRISTDILQ